MENVHQPKLTDSETKPKLKPQIKKKKTSNNQ